MRKQNKTGNQTSYRNVVLFTLFFFCFSLSLPAQEDLFDENNEDNFDVLLGLSMTCLPKEIVEEEISTMPMLEVGLNYKLGEGFDVGAYFKSAYITNVFSGSLSKTFNLGATKFRVGTKINYWLGMANLEGFDVNCHGTDNEVIFELLLPFSDHELSFKTGTVFNYGHDVRVGSVSYSKPCNSMTGMVYEVNYNQKLGNLDLLLGARINHCSSSYNTWIAFSSCQKRLLAPTLFVGVKL